MVNDIIELARKHGFSTRNPLGTITVFNGEEHLFLNEDGEAIAGVAAGIHHLTLWSSDVDSFLYCQREPDRVGDGISVTWYLDSAWTYRKGRPRVPADEFRRLYQQRTAMWVDGAESLDVMHGRIADESLLEKVWDRTGVFDESMAPGTWPSWLGWSTYLGPDLTRALPPLPLPEITPYVKRTPGGGQLITLLDDPAAVDEKRYWHLHKRWLTAGASTGECSGEISPQDRAATR